MSNKKVISTKAAPAAMGPYSQAIRAGNFLYLSGQLGVDPDTGDMMGDDLETQTRQAVKNIGSILSSVSLTFSDVIKTIVFLSDMQNFSRMNKIYQEYFSIDAPARSCIEVARLPKDALIEIESVAIIE
jgi:2-iminobutanoate/2-iminopropanoate deaminase